MCSRVTNGSVNRTSYSAAKSALVGCTKTWALELAPYGITVNAVSPGPIETELFRAGHPEGSDAEKKALSSIPMGRFGAPADVAAAVTFLLSNEAGRSEEHTSELQSLMRISYAGFCFTKKNQKHTSPKT